MSWKEKMKEWAPGNLAFLSADGALIYGVVIDDPVLLKGKYGTKEQERIGCPMMLDDGYVLFVTGKRAGRKLANLEAKFPDHMIMITRHGAEGDTNTTYEVTATLDVDRVKALRSRIKKEYSPEILKESIEAAEDVMK